MRGMQSIRYSASLIEIANDRIRPRMLIQNLPGCLTGTLLVASPALTEAGFRRSVVFLFAHSPDGAMGLIVNRALRTGSALRHLRDSGVAGESTDPRPLHIGGPLDRARCLLLHSDDYNAVENTVRTPVGLGVTASDDALHAVANGRGPENWLLARGHAAWAPGQLEQELNEGAWLTAPALDWTIFQCDDNLKWPAALRGLGIAPEGLSAHMGRA